MYIRVFRRRIAYCLYSDHKAYMWIMYHIVCEFMRGFLSDSIHYAMLYIEPWGDASWCLHTTVAVAAPTAPKATAAVKAVYGVLNACVFNIAYKVSLFKGLPDMLMGTLGSIYNMLCFPQSAWSLTMVSYAQFYI